ncbi:hypothetical protein [Deinococcus peraridilitoris]|uniref:hypothetical protein n=1 Tax=Deinococcus peraridilitoris TaxID=432329 RepID=UPI0002DA4838|nr:hypothetical protein [Deinococcus peraridilitoris]
MKTFGPYVAARALQQGVVSTVRGVDRVTGMPVLLFVFPHSLQPVEPLPALDDHFFVPYSDFGTQGEDAYAVAALPLSAHPATDRLLTMRGALSALAWLHERGLTHGAPLPANLWSTDAGVRLAGAALPWAKLGGGFDPPEGGRTPQTDLFILGRTLERLGGLPAELSHLLSDDPVHRGTARSALERLDANGGDARVSVGVRVVPGGADGQPALPDETKGAHAPTTGPEIPTQEAAALPAATVIVEAQDLVVDRRESALIKGPALLIDDSFDDPARPEVVVIHPRPSGVESGAPAVARAAQAGPEETDAPPGPLGASVIIEGLSSPEEALRRPAPSERGPSPQAVSPRGQPIRIGWDEDDSWRVVKSGPGTDRAREVPWLEWIASHWRYLAVVLLPLFVVSYFMTAGPREVPAECCRVQFEVRGAQNVRGRLEVIQAPAGSGLKAGALLSTVPGTVQFPNAPGRYTLRLLAEGYRAQTLQLQLPTRQPVIIEVAR